MLFEDNKNLIMKKYYLNMPTTKRNMENLLLTALVWVISFMLGNLYTAGDQVIYVYLYDGVRGTGLVEGFLFYKSNIHSVELLHFLFNWIGSNLGIEKVVFYSFVNSCLALCFLLLLRKWNVSFIIILLIILTNYYFYVLYFSAERLKFGFLFLFLSFMFTRYYFYFSILSVLSHFQLIIIYLSIIFNKVLTTFYSASTTLKIKYSDFRLITLSIFIFLVVVFVFSGHLISKFEAYFKWGGIEDLLKISVFFALALWYSKNKIQVFLVFIPLFIAVYFLGGERVNMMGYFVFLFYGLQYKRGLNFGILVTSAYFLYTNIVFVDNIIKYGEGFNIR